MGLRRETTGKDFQIRVIGVVGQNGSGKDEVLKYLNARYGIPFLSTGDIVREIAVKQGIEPTRTNLRELSDRYFKNYGRGHFIRMAVDRIFQNGWKMTGISGIRSPEDVAILRNILGHDFILIAVTVTNPNVRYGRMIKRGESRDHNTILQFRQQDEDEERLFHITEAMRQADYTVSNDGSLTALHHAVNTLVNKKNLLST
ncbi:MAG: AAA family ATPase [Chloroflexota bacterium]